MVGLFVLCLTILWTSTHALKTESYVPNPDDQLSCSETYDRTGVCKSVMYDMKHLSCIPKKSTSGPLTQHESRMLTFTKVSMCVPVCDESCDGLTTSSSVSVCRQISLQRISNNTDVYQSYLLHVTTEAPFDRDLHFGPVLQDISLHQICAEGRLCMVQFLLSQRPADINTRDKLGRTPIMVAVMKHQVTVFDFLVGQSCDLMTEDNNNDTVLHVACDVGNVDIVRKLVVNHMFDIECRGRKGMTPVMKSALHGHRDVFELLVSKGCNVTILDDNMNNILHVACSGGHVDMVKYILRILHSGISDIESRGEKGRTPVMIAAHSGHIEVFEFLERSGSNLLAADDSKDNILHVACTGGHVNIVQHILRKALIDIESRGHNGRTPVMRAAQCGHRSIVDFLVSRGCNLTAIDDISYNLLHVACVGGHVDMVKHILSQQNFSVESRGYLGQTPVMAAAYFGHKSVFMFLVNQGCKLMVLDKEKNNILHVACIGGNFNIVKHIVEKRFFPIDRRGGQGWTPVMFAAYFGHNSVLGFLVNQGCKLMILDARKNNILHVACMGGHVDTVKQVVKKHTIGIESRGEKGRTPVMFAAYFGHKPVFMFLVNQGCNLMVLDKDKNNILHVACMGGHVDIVKHIIGKHTIGIERRGEKGWTPVMFAANFGHMSVVIFLVNQGCNQMILDAYKNNILHVACIGGHVDIVKHIVEKYNIGIESRGVNGWTPVMFAAQSGHESVFVFLVNQGCKLMILDKVGNNILHVACFGGHVNIVKHIIEKHSIGIESRGEKGWTPVMFAANFGHMSVVIFLVNQGCNRMMLDAYKNNILHVACMGGHADIVKHIVEKYNIGIESRGVNGWTPVMFAAQSGHESVFVFLVNQGCKLMILDKVRNNILHVACFGGHVNIVKHIVEKLKIAINIRGQNGRTPVMTAACSGHTSVVKYFVENGCNLTEMDENGRNVLELACMGRHEKVVKYLITIKSWSKTC